MHPCWVIGWASKAIIRYQKCNFKGFATNQFMDDCAEYIKDASKEFINSNIPDDKKGIVLRAFVALQLNNIYKPKEFQKNVSDLESILCLLWMKLKKCYETKGPNVDNVLFEFIKQKTKYDEYLEPVWILPFICIFGLFCLFEVIFDTFALSVLANRPLFAAPRECKSAQKSLSTKLEIKSKQILRFRSNR